MRKTPPLDTLIAIVAISGCLAVEAALLSFGVDDLDEGYFAEQAARVVGGQVPYRDFESLYTPGLTYLHAAAFAVIGEPSILSMRVLSLAFRAGIVVLMYRLARPLVPPLWAALAPIFLLVGLDAAPDRWNTHPGWPSAFAGLLAVWATARWAGSTRPTPWLVVAGAATALAYAFKQNAGVFVGLAIAMFVVAHPHRRLVNLAWLAGGFIGLTALWLAPLLVSLGGDPRPLAHFVGSMDTAALFYPPEPLNALALAALIGGIVLAVVDRRHPSAWRLRWYLLGGLGLFMTQYPRMDTMHLAWSAPVLLVLGVAALARLPKPVAAVGVVIVGVCAMPMLAWRGQAFVGQSLSTIEGVPAANGLLVPHATGANLSGVVEALRERTAPHEPIFVYPTSPLLYVAADRPNPTRYAHLYPGAASLDEVRRVIDQLDAANVNTVVIDDFWLTGWGPPGANALLEMYLADHFEDVARYGAYRVLERPAPVN